MYIVLKSFRDLSQKNNEWDHLSHEAKLYIDKNIQDAERGGIGLSDEKKEQMSQINQEMHNITKGIFKAGKGAETRVQV